MRGDERHMLPAAPTSICALLSQALVAFTIEFDNEAERRIRTAGSQRQFLVSLALWGNYLRFVPEEGIRVRELGAAAFVSEDAIRSRLGGFERWRYVFVEPDQDDARAKPPMRDWIVRLTPAGRRARKIWLPLTAEIEDRWRVRFGERAIAELRAPLEAIVEQLDVELPDYLPVLGYGFATGVEPRVARRAATREAAPKLALPALISRVLSAFALEYERESQLSLALVANYVRVLVPSGVLIRELPSTTGTSKEAVAMATGYLARHGYAVVEDAPGASRSKQIRLTEKGARSRKKHLALMSAVEAQWNERYGSAVLDALRTSLRSLLERRTGDRALISAGLEPWSDGWRARKPYVTQTKAILADPAASLPHFPMVLHRGGWPDGS